VYIRTIEEAGFREVRIAREARFADAIALDDPQVREAMDRFGITLEQVKDFLDAVTSLHIFAVK
jgi:hypothetical protein